MTNEECFKNTKDFQNNKTPGIDGLGKAFYVEFWDIIGEDLTEVINNIYLTGEMTESMKTGIITLSYKNKGNFRDLKQWRPKSLLCFDYKTITKTLTKKNGKSDQSTNRYIKSTIQINGHLTKEIKIERSIRQGCSLSITIYALIIEPLASNIRNLKDIKGINLPNRKEKCALFQHADDCSTIITEISDYDHLVKEFKRFGEVSGSKINESKTEILEIRRKKKPIINQQIKDLIKENVKVLGIKFGENKIDKNWNPIVEAIAKTCKEWENRNIDIYSKVQIINTYMLSKAWFVARVISPTQEIKRRINRALYKFIWNGPELIKRTTLNKKKKEGGGIQMPDIEEKINAMWLQKISDMIKGKPTIWKTLYTYFLGITTREFMPELADNKYSHSEQFGKNAKK
ncbi:unnamed protein product [Mytilus coruscus]|uniref:Reverse transcriptase domain-containing protein n=1 Tax=Mytilus coruscus TaxID=42192 RepID=A0A6J8AKZ2_MYTCO|nr:unnamed protein product [Mytilus coruscus]